MSVKSLSKDIERLQREIEKQLNWGKATSWHSTMFSEFSLKIFEATKVRLSVATLKRFFGVVDHQGSPSTTTLDTLSQFVGLENWRAFRHAKPIQQKFTFNINWKAIYLGIGFFTAILIISLLSSKRPALVINKSEFKFTSRVLSDQYPNSVVFDFDIPTEVNADNFHIQQYWDKTKTITLNKLQSQATGIYYFPGYFQAKLMVNDEVVSEHDLFLKSDGWLGTIEYDPVPKYFNPLLEGGGISFSDDIYSEVTNSVSPLISVYHYINDLGNVSADNFSFSATVQSKFGGRWAVCQSLRLYFIGTEGAMIIPFSKLGCSSDNNLMLNDIYLSGKENDLSALSANLSSPTTLNIQIKDQLASIMINGENVYELKYNKSMGNLVGLRFKFLGLGEVLSYEILDKNQSKVPL